MNIQIVENTRVLSVEAYVESETNPGYYYRVSCHDGDWNCSCPANRHQITNCKHIKAVQEQTE